MKTLQDVYQRLTREQIAAGFNDYTQTLEVWKDDVTVEATGTPTLTVVRRGHRFPVRVRSLAEVYVFLCGVMNGRITFTSESARCLCMKGWNPKEAEERSKVGRIVCVCIGLVLLFLAVCIGGSLIAELLGRQKYGLDADDLELCATVPFYLFGGLTGLGLLLHGLMNRPRFRAGWFVPGALVTGFAATEILMGWTIWFAEQPDEPISDTVGATVVMALVFLGGLAMLFAAFYRKKEEPKVQLLFREAPLPPEEERRRLIAAVREKTDKPCIRIVPDFDREPTLRGSKVGGVPYWDLTRPYPYDGEGEPMALVMQLDLAELPENDKLPREGLLQFFLTLGELYTGRGEPAIRQWQVVYHPHPDASVTEERVRELGIPETEPGMYDDFPVYGTFAVHTEHAVSSVYPYAEESTKIMHETAKKLGISLDPSLEYSELMPAGEGAFPRLFGHSLISDYIHPTRLDTPLLQLVSIWDEDGERGLAWSEDEIGVFFISEDRMKMGRFEDVSLEISEV